MDSGNAWRYIYLFFDISCFIYGQAFIGQKSGGKMSLTNNKAFVQLQSQFDQSTKSLKIIDLLNNDSQRFNKYKRVLNTADGDILFDFSKNLVTDEHFKQLIDIVIFYSSKRKIF